MCITGWCSNVLLLKLRNEERYGRALITTRDFQWSWQGQHLVLGLDEAGDGALVLLLPALSSISTRGEMHPLIGAVDVTISRRRNRLAGIRHTIASQRALDARRTIDVFGARSRTSRRPPPWHRGCGARSLIRPGLRLPSFRNHGSACSNCSNMARALANGGGRRASVFCQNTECNRDARYRFAALPPECELVRRRQNGCRPCL